MSDNINSYRQRIFNCARAGYKNKVDHARWSMAEAHAVVIRGFDTIEANIDTIQKEDYSMWIRFVSVWTNFMHHHHEGEELYWFPRLAKVEGMETNKKQHSDFLPFFRRSPNTSGNNCIAGNEDYSPKKVKDILSNIREPLFMHLSEELDTLAPERLSLHYDGDYFEKMERDHFAWTKATTSLNKDLVFLSEFRNQRTNITGQSFLGL